MSMCGNIKKSAQRWIFSYNIVESVGVAVHEVGKGDVLKIIVNKLIEPTRQAEISYAVFCLKKKKNTQKLLTKTRRIINPLIL